MNNAELKVRYEEYYNEYEKQRYLDFLPALSDNICFDDDKWVCEKRIKSAHETPRNVAVYFAKTPEKYTVMVKYYAIILLIQGQRIKTVCRHISNINTFLRFMNDDPLHNTNILTASRFKEHIDSKGLAESSRAMIWADAGKFLTRMNGYEGITLKNPFSKNIYCCEKLYDSKYIPNEIANRLDVVFRNDSIQLQMRCIYWILRMIPSRISEILGMKIDCIKPFDGNYCIIIPMWKQNGGYQEGISRIIHVKDEGMGGYLLSLIREQQKIALLYQGYVPENKKNALFTYRQHKDQFATKVYRVATYKYVSYHLKKNCGAYNIRDEQGNPYDVTSHQFRHNGITDRLRAGFTMAQIAEMTAHHGTAMIYASYTHLNLFPETLVEPNLYTTEKSKSDNPYILFGGKILNMDAINESRLLSNLRAHRVPGGICSDVTHCKSGMWDCLFCDNFVPEKEQLPYFEEQVIAWKDKAELFKNDAYMGISKQFEKIIVKIKREDVQDNG